MLILSVYFDNSKHGGNGENNDLREPYVFAGMPYHTPYVGERGAAHVAFQILRFYLGSVAVNAFGPCIVHDKLTGVRQMVHREFGEDALGFDFWHK